MQSAIELPPAGSRSWRLVADVGLGPSSLARYLEDLGRADIDSEIGGDIVRGELRLQQLAAEGRDWIICGDWNIAHREIDLKNWRGNQKNSGFLPEERAWMDELFGTAGFVDTFRAVNAEPDQYTWWSNRGQAWARNVGWRIDYQVATPGIAATVKAVRIYKEKRFSDHAPLIIDYDYDL